MKTIIALLTVFLCSIAGAQDLPFLHPLFSDHMVLQRDIEAPVRGWATADASGRWIAKLAALPAGGPHERKVTGAKSVTMKDVLVGDVWIFSGQSNMEWPVAAANDRWLQRSGLLLRS